MNYVPLKFHVESLPSNAGVFGDTAVKRKFKLNEVIREALIPQGYHPYKKRHVKSSRNSHVRAQVAVYKPGRQSSPGTSPTSTLILDSPETRTMKNKFLLFKPPVYGIWCWQLEQTKTCKIPRVVKFLETKSRMVIVRG